MILCRLIFMMTLICLLAACGQRGPLYLPEETAPPAATQPSAEKQEAEPEDDDTLHGGGFETEQPDQP
jgi:predicted small lipoprotein YifL